MKDEDLSGLRIDREKRGSAGNSGRLWFLVSCFLLLALILVVYLGWVRGPVTEAVPAERITAIEQRDLKKERASEGLEREVLIASGYVVAHHKHELGSKVMGRVEWIGVEKGDFVRKGQLLVKLEDREYRSELDQSRAALKLARERLAELEAGSRPEEIERGEAELKRSQADELNARIELRRLEELLQEGVVSKQAVDNARARLEMAEATRRSTQKSYELLLEGPRAEHLSQAAAEVQQAEAAVEYAQALLDATEIRAPITGTVLRRIAEIGEMVTTSFAGESGAKSAVVALADLTDLQVELDISQTDFNRISQEQECQMTPEAFEDRVYACEIDEISPEANRQKASIQVKVKILEPDDYLRPEMSARVTFLRRDVSE